MSDNKSILVRYPADAPPVLTELVTELVSQSDFAVKLVSVKKGQEGVQATLVPSGDLLDGDLPIARFLTRHCSSSLNGVDSYGASQIDQWLPFAEGVIQTKGAPRDLSSLLQKANLHMALRTYFVEPFLTIADVIIWLAIHKCGKESPKALKVLNQFPFVNRWFLFLSKRPEFEKIYTKYFKPAEAKKAAPKPKKEGINVGHTGGYLQLENVKEGDFVCTRFPPEPSGYLHIGHAKAALLNYHYAKQYQGKLIIRFDDTNPTKEKHEYMENILEDLKTLNIPGGDKVTYTSDHFEEIERLAVEAIKNGHAYIDNTPLEEIREKRMVGDTTPARDNSVEENLRLFDEMRKGSEEGCKCIMRAKIESEHGPMKHPNKALRDPALYRVIPDANHPRLGTKYKAYPLYDWACPIVDSVEGVTHALRSNEYHDRNPLYYWVLETTGLRKVYIEDFCRLNFSHTVLSKRKLQWFVDTNRVSGWNDPAFPTIQGIVRRGLTLDALREFVISQGSSKSVNLMDINKLWAINKKVLDPIVPRFTAIDASQRCEISLPSVAEPFTQQVPKHKKNSALGEKVVHYSNKIYIELADANMIEEGEEITLMDWGNCYAKKLIRDEEGNVTQIEGELHLEGSVKDTKKKLTWVDANSDIVPVVMKEYDTLINVGKIPPEGKFDDYVNDPVEFRTSLMGDHNLKSLKEGDSIQLERRGYFRCDRAYNGTDVELVLIPDGKSHAMSVITSKVGKKKDPRAK